jgi:hypothetical protein
MHVRMEDARLGRTEAGCQLQGDMDLGDLSERGQLPNMQLSPVRNGAARHIKRQ